MTKNDARKLARKCALIRALARRVARYVCAQRLDLNGSQEIIGELDREAFRLAYALRNALERCEVAAYELRKHMENE